MSSIHDVRYFDSTMTGAPASSNTASNLNGAGKLLQLLDGCLVDGFNVQAVSQIVVLDGIATATTSAADHGYRDYTVIRVWGCAEAALNGDWKSSVTTGNAFSFPTTVANGTYGGTISAKTAPLGWSKPFSGTNIGVYRPGAGLRHYYRVLDTGTSVATIRGYESMTSSADAGTQPFPSIAQMSVGGYIAKSQSAAYKTRWALFGDDKTMYLIFSGNDNEGVLSSSGFYDYGITLLGEINSFSHSEIASCIATSGNTSGYPYIGGINNPGRASGGDSMYGGFYISRPWTQIAGAPTRLRCGGSGLADGWGSSSITGGKTPTPNPADGALIFHHPVLLAEETSGAIRGELPGLWQPLNTSSIANVGSVFAISGRKILTVRGPDASLTGNASLDRSGLIGVDITGPWR